MAKKKKLTIIVSSIVAACLVGGSAAAAIVIASSHDTYYNVTFDANGGLFSDGLETKTISVKKGSKVSEPETPTYEGYTLSTWNYGNEEWSFAANTVTNDMTLTADWSANLYNVTVTSEDINKGTVTGGGTYAYGETVTVTATLKSNTADPYSLYNPGFTGWYDGNKCVSTISTYTFTMPAKNVDYVARFKGTKKAIGDTVLFGSYPQSKVTDSTTKSTLTSKAGTLPSSSNSQKWTPYNWYISSSNTTKFAWYIDLDTNSDGQNDYRGVYFTSCRPFRVSGTSYEGGSKQYLMVIQNPLSIGLNMNQLNGEY